jgi:hypothetical protein
MDLIVVVESLKASNVILLRTTLKDNETIFNRIGFWKIVLDLQREVVAIQKVSDRCPCKDILK